MKPGVILTAREVEAVQDRLTAIGRLSSDRRIREQCRLTLVAMQNAARRASRYMKEEAALLDMIHTKTS